MPYAPPLEARLITQIIDREDFHSIEKCQITEDFFSVPECREIYRYIREIYYHPQTPGLLPSRELVKERFPGFFFEHCNDAVGILCQELRKEKVRLEVQKLAQDATFESDHDPLAAMATLRASISRISALAEVGEDLSISSAYNVLLSNYDAVQTSGGVLGIPYPWTALNEETQGKLGEQFIVLYGRPGSMKSFLAIYMACYDYMVSRRRVLFYTREMSPILVAQRMAACLVGVSYKDFKNGRLQPALKAKAFQILKELLDDEESARVYQGNHPGIVIVSDRSAMNSGGGGVSWLRSKVKDVKPHMAYVDGMYLMKDDHTNMRGVDHKIIANISRDLKLLAQEFGIPVMGMTQANRAAQKSLGNDVTELAFSDALGQDADVVARVSKRERIDDNKVRHNELWLTFPKVREAELPGVLVIGGEPYTDFTFKRMLESVPDEDDPQPKKGNSSDNKASGPTYKKSSYSSDPKVKI